MKKLIALALALVLACSLAACSKGRGPRNLGPRPEPEAMKVPDTTKPIHDPVDPEPEETKPVETETPLPPALDGEIQIPETVIFDEGDVTVTVKANTLTLDGTGGYDIPLTVVNHSTKNIVFSLYDDAVAVNGYMIESWLYIEAEAGATEDGDLYLTAGDMEAFGITAPKTFYAEFYTFDSDTYDTLEFAYATFTSNAPEPAAPKLGYDKVLLQEGGITVVEAGLYRDDGDVIYAIQMRNDSDSFVDCYAENTTVNGKDIWTSSGIMVYPGCVAQIRVPFYAYDLEDIGVDFDSLTELEFDFVGYDKDSYNTIAEDTLSLNFG